MINTINIPFLEGWYEDNMGPAFGIRSCSSEDLTKGKNMNANLNTPVANADMAVAHTITIPLTDSELADLLKSKPVDLDGAIVGYVTTEREDEGTAEAPTLN